MLKILIILILIGYVFYRITSFIFSGLFRGFVKDQDYGNRSGQYRKRAPNSNVNIDSMPKGKSQKSSGYDGGEYVDYEEVK